MGNALGWSHSVQDGLRLRARLGSRVCGAAFTRSLANSQMQPTAYVLDVHTWPIHLPESFRVRLCVIQEAISPGLSRTRD
jgi:hypothetical protein